MSFLRWLKWLLFGPWRVRCRLCREPYVTSDPFAEVCPGCEAEWQRIKAT